MIALDGQPLEIQIRTHAMHQVSEVGIAAHWRYKEGSRADREYDAKLAWLRQVMDWQRDVSDATEFVEGVKLDVFQDQVFVFTPKGEVKDLPAGATPLDFAYRIHTDIGHRCIGAKVNNRLVPLDYQLKNGDIVEIVTTKGDHGPSRDWMNIVRTSHAREKIRQWFKRQERDENIVHGRESLERELRRLARTSLGAVGPGSDPGDRAGLQATTTSTTSTPPSATGRSVPSRSSRAWVWSTTRSSRCRPPLRRRALRARAACGSRAWATCSSASASAAIRSRATRSSASSRAARALPSTCRSCQTVLGERETARLIEVDWEGEAAADLPDLDPHRGLRPDRPPLRRQPGRGRGQGQHRGCKPRLSRPTVPPSCGPPLRLPRLPSWHAS